MLVVAADTLVGRYIDALWLNIIALAVVVVLTVGVGLWVLSAMYNTAVGKFLKR